LEKESPPIEIQKLFYHPICSTDEIERIFNPKNASDYLLTIRADTAIDHMRIFRVIRNRALRNEKNNWQLKRFFNDIPFNQYLESTNRDIISRCNKLTAGFVFSNEPNGICEKTMYGNIIQVSLSIKYFLYFMNLAFYFKDGNIPGNVRINAARIAIRTMLKTEALDFNLDPRGIIPRNISLYCKYLSNLQIAFIIGHEYAHHYCGHLECGKLINHPRFNALNGEEDYGSCAVYNYRQEQEFEADLQSLKNISDEKKKEGCVFSSLLFFIYLDIYNSVSDFIYPPKPYLYETHPSSLDRFKNIFENHKLRQNEKAFFNRLLDTSKIWKEKLVREAEEKIELYEQYGSIYLAKPNTEWRGKALKDRVDYY
jgi:hypothetical protein